MRLRNRQQLGHGFQARQLSGARFALGDMNLHLLAGGAVQLVVVIRPDLVTLITCLHGKYTFNFSLSSPRARCKRDSTVPRGTPRVWAISSYERFSNSRSSNTSRCSADNCFKAACTSICSGTTLA